MFARTQLLHGEVLLHRTFRLRQVTQERGLRPEAEEVESERVGWVGEALLEAVEFWRLGDSPRRARCEVSTVGLISAEEGRCVVGEVDVESTFVSVPAADDCMVARV